MGSGKQNLIEININILTFVFKINIIWNSILFTGTNVRRSLLYSIKNYFLGNLNNITIDKKFVS